MEKSCKSEDVCDFQTACSCHHPPVIMCSKFYWKEYGQPHGGYECKDVCSNGVCPKDIDPYDGTPSISSATEEEINGGQ